MFADRHFTAINIFKTFVLTVLLVATMIFGAGYVYVNQAGGLRRLLETELSRMTDNGSASVGDARLNFALSRYPLQLAAENIVINLERDQIDLPNVEIGFGLTSLFDGRQDRGSCRKSKNFIKRGYHSVQYCKCRKGNLFRERFYGCCNRING